MGSIFTFGSDILACWQLMAWRRVVGVPGRAGCPGLPCAGHAFAWLWRCRGGGAGAGLVVVAKAGSGRPGGEAGEGLAASFAGFRGQSGGCAALVFFLPGVPGGEDALVAGDQQGCDEQCQGC